MTHIQDIASQTATFVLAGGRGARLAPLTHKPSKPAVPFGDPGLLILLWRIAFDRTSNILPSSPNTREPTSRSTSDSGGSSNLLPVQLRQLPLSACPVQASNIWARRMPCFGMFNDWIQTRNTYWFFPQI